MDCNFSPFSLLRPKVSNKALTMIGMKIIVCSLLLGIISAKPVENDPDYRQFQTSEGNFYSNPTLSGGYAVTQGSYSGYPVGYVMPHPIQSASMSSYMTPFGFQGFGGGYGMPGYVGFPNIFG